MCVWVFLCEIDSYNDIIDLYNDIIDSYNAIIDSYNVIIDSYNDIIDPYNDIIDSYNEIVKWEAANSIMELYIACHLPTLYYILKCR